VVRTHNRESRGGPDFTTFRRVPDHSPEGEVVFVREDDPRCRELEELGFTVTGYSWGANLRLDETCDLTRLNERVANVAQDGFTIRELHVADLALVVELERRTADDYPVTLATNHVAPSLETLIDLLAAGARAWGAFTGDELIAVTLAKSRGERWNSEFTSVLSQFRGRGIGSAVKAASLVALFNDGHRWFSTGGAESNSASLGANLALGYVLEPRWRTYVKSLE
jgi:GNAT superfamily N-acetyltransferase